jgi:hypothetical protein
LAPRYLVILTPADTPARRQAVVNPIERALRRVDRYQQRHRWLGFPFAVVKKFSSLTVAQVVIEAWRIEHNTYRPRSALAASPLPSTRPTGPAHPNPSSHSEWTTNRGPVS